MKSRSSKIHFLRASAIAIFCVLGCLPLSANPFIGSSDKPQAAPVAVVGIMLDSIIHGQLALRDRLANYLGAWQRTQSGSLLLVIIGLSFLYGILHALGPGHRKTVVFSIYIARRAPWWEPLASSLALAGLHGGTAIILLIIFRGVSGAFSVATDSVATYMEGLAYCVLIVMALALIIRAITDLSKSTTHDGEVMSLSTLILTGVYPCPGAILVLVFCLTLKVMAIGIAAVTAMSLGMSIPIALFAYMGWFGRSGILQRLKKNEAKMRTVGAAIEIGGFSLLLFFSSSLLLDLYRPAFHRKPDEARKKLTMSRFPIAIALLVLSLSTNAQQSPLHF